MLPKVSVIIPNYNHELYLRERIESVLNQTYSNIEIIILDDCSSDNSREVIMQYKDSVDVIDFNEVNSGTTFKQWNKGINLATGEWVWIAESDDWCEPTLLQALMAGVGPSTSLAFCQSVIVNNNEVLWTSHPKTFASNQNGMAFVQERMLKDNAIFNASMCIFRKANYYKLGPEFTTYRFCGDWLFWISLAQYGDVYESGRFLNYFRKHGADVSGPAYQRGLSYIEHSRLLNYLLEKEIIDLNKIKYLSLLKFHEFLHDKRLRPEYANEVAQLLYARLGQNLLSTQAYHILGKKNWLRALLRKSFL